MDRESGWSHLPVTEPFELRELSVEVYRAPIADPVRTAFGVMQDRPAVVVTARAADDTRGRGEIWCNFPSVGAEHRARLAQSTLFPEIAGRLWSSPAEVCDVLIERTRILALQTGEPGPLNQAIAGIDMALWDLVARRAGVPLWRLLGGEGDGRVPSYASGIGPDESVDQAGRAQLAGHQAYKLKVGFGRDRDVANLQALRSHLGSDVPIAVDANQAWELDEALTMSEAMSAFDPLWLEEPMPVDRPPDEWHRLAEASPIPLAGGENLASEEDFEAVIAAGALQVIQPDLAKWGGITKVVPLAGRILAAGHTYCPHYLGGGIGLVASAHVLAAIGGAGLLEMDSNPNPLRDGLATPFPSLEDGTLVLAETPGLGVEPDPATGQFAVPLAD